MSVILIACLVPMNTHVSAEAAGYAISITVTDKAYGALAGKDSTKAIQKALDEAAKKGTKSSPALVKIPAGTYYISSSLNIGSNTVLSLDKAAVMKKAINTVLYMLRSKPGNKGGFSDNENISVCGGVWDAEYKLYNSNSGGTVMFFTHCSNLTIKDTEIRNNYGTHLIELGGVDNVLISGCKLHGFKTNAGATQKEAIQLDVVHNEEMMPAAGIFDDSPCKNITVTKNEIYDYPRAVGSHMGVEDIYHSNIKITSNKFHDIEGAAIYGYNYVNCTIKKNTMKNVGMGVVLRNYDMGGKNSYIPRLKGVKAMSVKNNKYNYSIESNTISCSTVKAENVKAKDDSSSGDSSKAKGIFITGEQERPIEAVSVIKNKITADTSGIFIQWVNNSKISSNYLDRTKSAYDVNASKYVEDCIKLNSCSGCTLSKNKISTKSSKPYENGIAIRSSEESGESSKISGGKANILSDNIIKYCAKTGVGIYAAYAEIKGGSIAQIAGNGITTTQGAKVSLKDLKLSKIDKIAVSINGKSECVISGLSVEDCGGSGFYASSSAFEMSDCSFKNITEKGIMATTESEGTVKNCTIDGCLTDYGLFASGASKLSADKLLISKCGKSGVYSDGSEISVKNSEIYNCTKSGFTLNNSKVLADNNIIKGNEQRSFTIMGRTKATITNNYMLSPFVNNEISKSDESTFTPYFESANRKKIQSMGNEYSDECGNIYAVE
ncbi:MAG: right-handed parallel beta-helix repeat-containing protein [Lachnospiraceae bacterium]|nr:right-handed parallel beta-helix repeat-containing protein [Lachnospiraceae bacterium]